MSGNAIVRWLGVLLALLAVWPMAYALDAVGGKDYLGGILLLGLTWLIARTGVELVAASPEDPSGRGDASP